MKRLSASLFLFGFSFLFVGGNLACRSIKKAKSSSDSSVVRKDEQRQNFQSETSEEWVIESDNLSPSESIKLLSGISMDQPRKQDQLSEMLGLPSSATRIHWPIASSKGNGISRVILRKISRESSQKASKLSEEKNVRSAHIEKFKERNVTGLLLISLLAIVILVIVIILYLSKRSD